MSKVTCLSAAQVASVLTLEETIPIVREAFASLEGERSRLFPVVRESVPDSSGIFGVKSGYFGDRQWLGLKAGGFWAKNSELGLPAHQSAILLFDPKTGVLQALVDANLITLLRTGAVGALASRYLARPDSTVAAVVGCGAQGQIQTRALVWALPGLKEIRCYDAYAPAMNRYIEATGDMGGRVQVVRAESEEAAVRGADVVVTTTPSWKGHVMDAWVRPDAHVSAIGADTRGKQELDVDLFRRARLVVDDLNQAREIGESQHAFTAGITQAPWARLGQLCAGTVPGRGDYGGLTIFDATGIALQDLVAAGRAVELARARGAFTELEI